VAFQRQAEFDSRSNQLKGGKSIMKKRFAVKFVVGLACIALLVSVMSFSGMTAGVGEEHPSHLHDMTYTGFFYRAGQGVPICDSQHECPVQEEYACACGLRIFLPNIRIENHLKIYTDHGHVPGTQTHAQRVTCVHCTYNTIETYFCPGPPCMQ
jgi:hypothetical protein